jgi:hypothetical protein
LGRSVRRQWRERRRQEEDNDIFAAGLNGIKKIAVENSPPDE